MSPETYENEISFKHDNSAYPSSFLPLPVSLVLNEDEWYRLVAATSCMRVFCLDRNCLLKYSKVISMSYLLIVFLVYVNVRVSESLMNDGAAGQA